MYFGKPYREVYNLCFNPNEKVLAIGDNLRTDIKGANNLNIDCIFILKVSIEMNLMIHQSLIFF